MINYFKKVQELCSLGLNSTNKFKILFYYIFLSIKRLTGVSTKFNNFKKIKLRFNNQSYDFYLKNQLDFDVLKDTFINEEYNVKLGFEPKIIFDLGGNIGTTALYFLLKYPGSTVYIFEPDPANVEQLQLNTKKFEKRIKLFKAAVVGDNRQEAIFHICKNRHWSSSLVKREGQVRELRVKAVNLDNIIKEYNIGQVDILKFDIEGAEYEVFQSFNKIDKVKLLIGEVHPNLFKASVDDFLRLLPKFKILFFNQSSSIVCLEGKLL